ncbi:hypothetical protein JRO89_XS12G0163600 [Xanthoceras sorbifolium]|uniref:Uncharacterized protein n=1 Tax=Xanthoceras sorbifolium TaxID=99658 RepID=A0ABQ8HCW7_9ROSI|nr:hypothetical protein JRO89_XS12G0163600 [Xanthoceras sorbifolium]
MENSQTSPTTPTASTSASGEPVIVLISANTTAQVLNDQSFLRLWTSWLCRWNLPMSVANRSWIYFLDEELIRNHGEPNEEEVQVTAQFTQKRFNQKGRGGRGRHCGGYNNTTHGTDNNLGGQNSQPNHMQFNRQQQTFYGRGHSAKTCRYRGQLSSQFPRPQANLIEGESSYPNKNWDLNTGASLAKGRSRHNLYEWSSSVSPITPSTLTPSAAVALSSQLWHQRLSKNLDNVVALTDDSPDSVILPSSALHILPQASLGYPSPDHQVVSTLASHKAALRQSPT